MAVIQAYNNQVGAQGEIEAHRQIANMEDFGGQVGEGMSRLGGALGDAAGVANQMHEAEDVTNIHVAFAKARAQAAQQFEQMKNGAQPGDDTFAANVMTSMQQSLSPIGDTAQTRKGQMLAKSLEAGMVSEFGQQAVAFQGELAARDAQNKYTDLSQYLGTVAYSDPKQVESVIKQGAAAIDDPSGIFARVPQTTRDSLKLKFGNDMRMAAASAIAERDPSAILHTLDPEKLQQFNPYGKTLDANVAPGGKVSISQDAMKLAPKVMTAAATQGLNANIMLAQLDTESGGKSDAVSPMGAAGVAQFMPDTAAQYGVNVKDVDSSIKGQAAYMGDLVRVYGGDYQKALAAYNYGPGNLNKLMQQYGNQWQQHLPAETQNYLAKVMQKSGMVSVGAPPPVQEVSKGEPVDTGPLAGLTWEQQDHLVTKSVQMQHEAISNQMLQMELANKQRVEAQRGVENSYIQQIMDPDKFGHLDQKALASDNRLDGAAKWQISQMAAARVREVESNPHPEAVRGLMLQIHAADNDPTKTYNMEPVDTAYRLGTINTNEYKMLRTEVDQLKTGDGNSFQQKVHMAREFVYGSLTKSAFGQAMPEAAVDASYRFMFDLNNKVEQLRKENKDPSTLLDPTSRDYMLKPEIINSYMMGAKSNIAVGAAKTVQAGAGALPSYKEYDSLKPGQSYTAPDGSIRTKK